MRKTGKRHNRYNSTIYLIILLATMTVSLCPQRAAAQSAGTDTTGVATDDEKEIGEVTVVANPQGRRLSRGVGVTEIITAKELQRAACCNLGESFTTNPSVDVSYSDAATGAKQIRLLGLSGTYVQMLTENIPNYRGAAQPYALGFIAGPWMQSIQVSKGASSVKNGYESITGQINVEFKKPQATEFADANLYVNSKGKLEANIGANVHLNNRLSTALLGHYELLDKAHDSNGDGFMDMPKIRQLALQNRWAWMGDHYVFQASVKGLKEKRTGGQTTAHGQTADAHHGSYGISITNERYEAFTKNAYIFDKERSTNVALILAGSLHHENALYGYKLYNTDQTNGYASLMFESDFGEHHSVSTGLSVNYDYYKQYFVTENSAEAAGWQQNDRETTPGAYAQYTYKVGERFTLMAGLRADHSSEYGWFVTPRTHLKYEPVDGLTLRASAGLGYRTTHPLAENNYLLASGREVVIDDNLEQERAWNFGLSAAYEVEVAEKKLQLAADYYYTDFDHQVVVDLDSDPHAIHFTNLRGRSYSHTYQLEATYPFFRGFTLTATYRRTNVKSTYGGRRLEKPLTGRYKGLITASYQTPLGLWQFDATLQLNGSGRMPEPYQLADGSWSWENRYPAYAQLSAQVTRLFRYWSIYLGAENLTGYKQKNPIVEAANPWSRNFDSTMVWGPVHGAVFYLGVRVNWTKI